MVGLYRIENTASDHASILKSTVLAWGERQPDVYLVSKEGVKVYTQRIILCFYSKMVGMLVESNKDDLVGISVPASSTSLTMMLKVLVSGSVIGNNKENLLEVGHAAEALGITLNDRQIGYRRKTQGGQTGQQMGVVKETVEISGRKASASASLKNHKLLHTGEVHKCEYCEYTAVQKGNLKTHRLKLHKDLLEQNEVEGNIVQYSTADESVKVTTKEEIHNNHADSVIEIDGEKGYEGDKDNGNEKVDGEKGETERSDETGDPMDE